MAAAFAWLLVHPAPAAAQWTLGAFAGAAHTRPADLILTQPGRTTDLEFPATPFRGESLRSPIYYGYRIGHALGRDWLFVEGEVIHAKAYAEADAQVSGSGLLRGQQASAVRLGDALDRFAMSHGLNLVFVNVAARRPVASGRLVLLVRAGAGPVVPHVEAEIDGIAHEGYQWSGPGVQAAAGAEVPLWRGLHASVEYKFTAARVRAGVGDGEIGVNPRTHHLAVGATWGVGGVFSHAAALRKSSRRRTVHG